jgi:glyoxylase-like metal-dependent hydrolase (beta-lactamase superfamily II)
MHIHQLDCAPVRPYFPPVASSTLCTLVEAGDELILVDTGLGTRDLAAPSTEMRLFTALMRSPRDPAHTAYYQIAALGYRPADVTHILVTHLHLDHSGGLPDLPAALVHVTRAEYESATSPRGVRRLFYEQAHWEHGPRWRIHEEVAQEAWFDFDATEIREIQAAPVVMVPLAGHSPGHVGVAVETSSGWLLHCGDALPFGGLKSDAPDSLAAAGCGPTSTAFAGSRRSTPARSRSSARTCLWRPAYREVCRCGQR